VKKEPALEKDHDEAAAFEAASSAVRARIGISSKEEYLKLERAAGEAWLRVERARRALNDHIRDHGCNARIASAGSNI